MFFDILARHLGVLLLVLGLYITHIMYVECQMCSRGQVSDNILPCSPSHHPSLPLISTVLRAIPRHIHHLPTSIYLPYLPYYPLDVCILSTTP